MGFLLFAWSIPSKETYQDLYPAKFFTMKEMNH